MITVVALSPSVDVTYVVDELRPGDVHRPLSVHRQAGGKSLNAARAAATVGAKASAVAVLGGSAAQFISRELRMAGVDLFAIEGALETRSCVSVSSKQDGRMTEFYEVATAVSEREWFAIVSTVGQVLPSRPGWLAVSGSVPQSLDAGALAELVALGASYGLRTAIDGHGRALASAVDAGPTLVKLNRSEAAEMLDADPNGDLMAFAHGIHQRSRGMVTITDGVAGSVATDGRESWRILPSPARGHHPVGSGDSFLGGMLASFETGGNLADALRLGAGCATANAMVPGAARFPPGLALSLAAEVSLAPS